MLFIGTVTVISDIYVAQPILPVLKREFSVSPTVASLAVSLNIFALAIALLVHGPLSDYKGRKTVMVGSSILIALPTFLITLSEDFSYFLIMRVLQGIFAAGIAAIAIAYITEEFAPSIKGKAIGIYVGAMITAGLFGRVIGGILTALTDWRTMFAVFGMLNLLGGVLFWRYLPTSRRFVANTDMLASLKGMGQHFRNRYLIGAFIIAFCIFFTYTGSFTFMTFYLSLPPFNLTTFQISLVFLVYVSGMVSPFAGALSLHYGRQGIIYVGLTTAALGLLVSLWGSLFSSVAGLFLLCLGLFITQPAASALVGDRAGGNYGSASSLYLFFYYLGGSVGAAAPGPIWDKWGWNGVVTLCLGVLTVALIALSTFCKK